MKAVLFGGNITLTYLCKSIRVCIEIGSPYGKLLRLSKLRGVCGESSRNSHIILIVGKC